MQYFLFLIFSYSLIFYVTSQSFENIDKHPEKSKSPWFICVGIGHDAVKMNIEYIKAVMGSAVFHNVTHDFFPIILLSGGYQGDKLREIPSWLNHLNVTKDALVLYHDMSFYDKLSLSFQHSNQAAYFIYFDIPAVLHTVQVILKRWNINMQYENALYTDSDIIFQSNFRVDLLPRPKVMLMGAGEIQNHFPQNSGIIYFNLTSWIIEAPKMIDYAAKLGWQKGGILGDQELICRYYSTIPDFPHNPWVTDDNKVEYLPDLYNWKPYWGINKNARIVHFHGAKPQRSAECYAMFLLDDHDKCLYGKQDKYGYWKENLGVTRQAVIREKERYHLSNEDIRQAYAYYLVQYAYFSSMIFDVRVVFEGQ